MVLVDLQWIKGTQFFADNGDVLDSGTINIYDATTTSLRTTYSNYLGTVANTLNGSNQIVLAADGRLDESVYIPTGLWKFVLKDSDGNTLATEDNIEGALDTDALAITEALPNTPVISKTSDYTIVNGDQGKVINANPTGGSFVLTLPSAAAVGDGWRITIRHVGTANQVTIAGVSAQTVNGATSRALGAQYEALCLVSDGANWHIDGHAQGFNYGQVPFFYVESRSLTTPPSNPTAGARYITASSGTLTAAWATYTNGDVAESDGQGGWIRLVPAEGWTAYDKAANQHCLYVTSWEGLPSTDDPEESNLGIAIFSDQKASGTVGGTATANAWTTHTLNTTDVNNITGCSLAADTITLPAGDYLVLISQTHIQSNAVRTRFKSTTTAKVVTGLNEHSVSTDGVGIPAVGSGVLTLTAEEAFNLQYYRANSTGTSDLGNALSVGGENEIFARVTIIDIASLQGPQGDQGSQGPQGFAGFKYQYSSTTTQTDPGAGFVRMNDADLSLVTAAVIDATSAETGNPDISDEIASWDDTGILKIAKVASEQNWVTYNVTDVVDNGGYLSLTVAYRDHAGSFSNTDSISIQFIPKGEAGASGSSVLALDYQWNTATGGDPSSGKLLGNNGTLSSITTISVNDLDRLTNDVSSVIAAFDDSGASALRGHLYIIDFETQTNRAVFKVTGSVTDNTTYQTFSVTYVGHSGSFTNNVRVALLFVPAGATGTVGGTTGSTDEALIRADGTGGTTVQSSTINLDDIGAMTFPEMAAPTTPSSARASLYVKSDGRFYEKDDAGVERGLSSVGKQTVAIPATAFWARTTNGPGAASRELTTGDDIMIKGFAFDTTTEEAIQFYIPWPKGWNEGTLTARFFWTNSGGASTETVVWGISAGAFTDDDPMDSTSLGSEVTQSDTWLAQNDLHVTAETSAITVGNTPAEGDLVIFQVARKTGSDNMAGDADLLAVHIYYTTNAATDD